MKFQKEGIVPQVLRAGFRINPDLILTEISSNTILKRKKNLL